ncbi:MAG: NAD(P)H-dependent glycerol-3-phosphate dehydrogenase [Dehalococcoidia bacterium]|nr:NAD(P)H-dependent glycerol-3-phosphate dehydrogenase [Dehalococcoidia bacterium]
MKHIGIVGTGAWATTLGILLARTGYETVLWSRSETRAGELERSRVNERSVPGVQFPASMSVSASLDRSFSESELVIVAVPSVSVRENLKHISYALSAVTSIVCATKGIEIESGKRMSEVIIEELPGFCLDNIGVLSGPNLAPEIAAGKISSATVAFPSSSVSESVQSILSSDVFRVYRSEDVKGVELGGALKNIVAIGAGFIDGAGLGANIKAAYVTRGLHEITRLGVAMGAKADTFAGLSGMGDLIVTCYSTLSRNYRLGFGLASGQDLQSVLKELGQTVEGAPTSQAAVRLAHQLDIDMPITTATHTVLFEGASPRKVVNDLMIRTLQPENKHYGT